MVFTSSMSPIIRSHIPVDDIVNQIKPVKGIQEEENVSIEHIDVD